jgi:hypothetical protein
LLRDAADDNSARRIRELLELLEVLVDVMPRGRSLARGPNEQRTLDGRSERDQLARNAKGSGKSYRLSAISYQLSASTSTGAADRPLQANRSHAERRSLYGDS